MRLTAILAALLTLSCADHGWARPRRKNAPGAPDIRCDAGVAVHTDAGFVCRVLRDGGDEDGESEE